MIIVSNIEDLDYDGEEFRVKPSPIDLKLQHDKEEASKYLTKLDVLSKDKNALFIQKHVTRYFLRKQIKLQTLYKSILVRKITRILRQNLRQKKQL